MKLYLNIINSVFINNIFSFLLVSLFLLNSCKKEEKVKPATSELAQPENTIISKCEVGEHDFMVALVKNEAKQTNLVVDINAIKSQYQLRKHSFNELSSIKLECINNGFLLLYKENNGNSSQNFVHLFEKANNRTFIWKAEYLLFSDRNGFSVKLRQLHQEVLLANYSTNEVNDNHYAAIYDFNGFQNGKSPTIDAYFQSVKDQFRNNKISSLFVNKIVLEFLVTNIGITDANTWMFNDIGYYLQKSRLNEDAIYILKKVIQKFPKRTVAYVNIADAYWELDEKIKAKEYYLKYVEQMHDKKLENKIPNVVDQRLGTFKDG